MDFSQTMASRRSIRSFQQKDVDDAVLNALLNEALESPSSSNSQPYKIAIAQGEKARVLGQALLAKYQQANMLSKQSLWHKLIAAIKGGVLPDGDFKTILGKYPGEFQQRRVDTGKGLYKVLGIERHDKKARDEQMAKNFYFYDAPVAMFFFIHPGMTHTALVDLGIFMQSLMLGATARGLGTCAEGALGMWRSPLEQHFDIPSEYKLVCGLALGYPDNHPVNQFRPEKMSLDSLLINQK